MLSDTQRYALYFAVLLIIAGVAWLLGPVLSPFVGAGIFAYMCVPLVERLGRRKVPRTVAVAIVMLLGVLILRARARAGSRDHSRCARLLRAASFPAGSKPLCLDGDPPGYPPDLHPSEQDKPLPAAEWGDRQKWCRR
jgi:hypothetical protein